MKMRHPTLGTRDVPDNAQAIWARAGWTPTEDKPAPKPEPVKASDTEDKAAEPAADDKPAEPPKRKRGRPRKNPEA